MSKRWLFDASPSQWSSLGRTHREMSEAGLEVRMDDLPCSGKTLVQIIEADDGRILVTRKFNEHEIFSCEQWCLQQLNAYRSWK
ncbi:hypothetical protein [Escherichia phage TM1]|nr:hypothetical protein [Escherichia phage TM1]